MVNVVDLSDSGVLVDSSGAYAVRPLHHRHEEGGVNVIKDRRESNQFFNRIRFRNL